MHLAVDTLGQLLAAIVTPANEQERAPVAAWTCSANAATGASAEVASLSQGQHGPGLHRR